MDQLDQDEPDRDQHGTNIVLHSSGWLSNPGKNQFEPILHDVEILKLFKLY